MYTSFHRLIMAIRALLILNIGNSDFGFVSYFEIRASNFTGVLFPA
jgi:hypothetical protein